MTTMTPLDLPTRADMDPAPVLSYVQDGAIPDWSQHQSTVPKSAMNKLNERGQALYDSCVKRLSEGDVKSHFSHWTTVAINTGRNPPVKSTDCYALNSFDDIRLNAWSNSGIIQTSVIIMLAPDETWAVTHSGSLYSLDPEGWYPQNVYNRKVRNGELKPNLLDFHLEPKLPIT